MLPSSVAALILTLRRVGGVKSGQEMWLKF
jgi:hypothetical protein